jgi:protein-S-isoprenylcysteine O-methyltransferase Ste14
MTEKKMMGNTSKMVAILLDVLGIIVVLVGALYTHYHEGSTLGEGVFWIGWVLLIVSLIIFVWDMRKA